MQECNSVQSTCVPPLSLLGPTLCPWFRHSLALKTKKLGITYAAVLRHALTNPLEHGDDTGQHDHSVQNPSLLELGHQSRRMASCCPSKRKKSLSICCTMLTSVIKLTVATLSVANTTTSSCSKNFALTTNQLVRQEIDVWKTVTVHDNPLQWKRTTKWRGIWLRFGVTWLPSLPLLLLSAVALLSWPPIDSNDVLC